MNNDNNNDKNTEINNVTLEPKQKRSFENMEMPKLSNEQVVIETTKKKKKSIVPYMIFLFIVSLIVIWKNEEIISFIDSYTKKSNPVIVTENDDDLVDGLILINSNTSNIKVDDIKFYNFKKESINKAINYNYSSVNTINDINERNIYIEFYDSEKNLLYKKLFDVDNVIYGGEVKSIYIELDDYIYDNAYYAYVKKYNEEELNKESFMICKYTKNTENYDLIYENKYYFKNDLLVSYDISKSLEVIKENEETKRYLNDINSEINYLNVNKIENSYVNNVLKYSVDLLNVNKDFVPLYEKNTIFTIVKNKEVIKKWECE